MISDDYIFDVMGVFLPLIEFVVEESDLFHHVLELGVFSEPTHFELKSIEEGIETLGSVGEIFYLGSSLKLRASWFWCPLPLKHLQLLLNYI